MSRKMLEKAVFALFFLLFAGSAAAQEAAASKFQGGPLKQVEQLVEQKKWQEAERAWRALKGQVDNQLWHYNLGVLLARQGQPQAAAEQFEQALSAREPERTIWRALKQLRTQQARAAYADLFGKADEVEARLALKWLPATLNEHALADMQKVRQALESWRRAWMAQDVEAYLAHYADDFQPVNGMSHEQWVALRRERVSRPRFINIRLADVDIEPLTPTRIATTFRQRYLSNLVHDVVTKQLVWEKRGDRWVIVREVVLR